MGDEVNVLGPEDVGGEDQFAALPQYSFPELDSHDAKYEENEETKQQDIA